MREKTYESVGGSFRQSASAVAVFVVAAVIFFFVLRYSPAFSKTFEVNPALSPSAGVPPQGAESVLPSAAAASPTPFFKPINYIPGPPVTTSSPQASTSSCGNGVCDEWETCSSCAADCGCAEGYSCIEEQCINPEARGNGICTDAKKKSRFYCMDCGCDASSLCNEGPGSCVQKLVLSDAAFNATLSSYLSAHPLETVVSVDDELSGGKPVRAVYLSCGQGNETECSVKLVVNATPAIESREQLS